MPIASTGLFAALLGTLEPELVGNGDAPPEPIYYGEEAAMCAFPSAAWLGSCTATLVHPELVIYAAHCGSSYDGVFFGNDGNGAGFTVATADCATNPGWGGVGYGVDIAWCRLAEPVTDVAFTPPLMGCETEVLTQGREVWIVGFGQTEYGVSGVKHVAATTFNYVDGNGDANIGGNGTTVCFGDSGGPAYVQLTEADGYDGSWRAFGIASYVVNGCGSDGYSALMHNGIEWVEQASGVDVTPCHDADGTWNPSEACHAFPTAIGSGDGSWNPGCGSGPVGGWGTTCGEPFAGADMEPPTVTITSPQDGTQLELEPGATTTRITVTIDAQDDGGIAEVALDVDGSEIGALPSAPWSFDVDLAAGAHSLVARALDVDGQDGHSATVRIEVDDAPAASDTGGPGDDGGGGDDSSSGDDGANDDEDDGAAPVGDPALPPGYGLNGGEGCGCTSAAHRALPWWLALPLFARRRVRRRVAAAP